MDSINDASHLRILRDLGCDIVGVSDRFARIAGESPEHFGGTPYTDYRQMIESTKLEFALALGRHFDMSEIFHKVPNGRADRRHGATQTRVD